MYNKEEMKSSIENSILEGVKSNDVIKVMFQITSPNIEYINSDTNVLKILNIFDKYKIEYNECDNAISSFNLNRYWFETSFIPSVVEYNGVYPIEWDIEDILDLCELEYNGKVIIRVLSYVNGEYIGNH